MIIHVQLIKVDADLQTHLMNLCNCTNIMIHGISFECIDDSRASYSFLITGKEALEAATVLNYIFNNQEYLITDDGISFSSQNSIKNVTTTSPSSFDSDNDTIHLNIFILVLAVIFAVAAILVAGISVGM